MKGAFLPPLEIEDNKKFGTSFILKLSIGMSSNTISSTRTQLKYLGTHEQKCQNSICFLVLQSCALSIKTIALV